MDHGACNVVYLDRRAKHDGLVGHEALTSESSPGNSKDVTSYFDLNKPHTAEVSANIKSILSTFSEVFVCRTGSSCLSRITELNEKSLDRNIPTIVIIDIPYDEEQRLKRLSREPRTPSPTSKRRPADAPELDDIYGIHLLLHVAAEIQQQNLSKLIIPIAILSGTKAATTPNLVGTPAHGSQVLSDPLRMVRYLDAGAVDVLTSPIEKDRVHGLTIHAYRIYKEVKREESSFLSVKAKKVRKMSWVGVNEAKPYSYLREAMVSGLMDGICNPDNAGDSIDPTDLEISPGRDTAIAKAIGTWSFSAHDYTDDELLYGAYLMLEHALSMPEVEKWRMPKDELMTFLMASRAAYNSFVLYHNFRHVADVLQALFYFLVQIGTLPPYPKDEPPEIGPSSPIASLLKPFDALTLLISAIGHDVGHPGVNNAFLVALNSPLAQLYNDRSVLESFHCAAYSQILRRYWPVAFTDMSMRKLMINSILATDMGLHFKYMADLGNLQEKLAHNNNTLDGWNLKLLEEYKDLTCGLLIKCADISNVARKFHVARQWAEILTDEFSNQGNMEQELNLPTCLFGGPPVRDNVIKMGESQIGFMNIFARPLFESVTSVLPSMRFSVEELINNKTVWQQKMEEEKTMRAKHLGVAASPLEGIPSPRSSSHVDLSKLEEPRHHQSEPVNLAAAALAKGTSAPSTARSPLAIPSYEPPLTPEKAHGFPPEVHNSSRRSSIGVTSNIPLFPDKGSRRNSAQQGAAGSRRGSADASLTTILVTSGIASSPRDRDTSSNRNTSPTRRQRPTPPTGDQAQTSSAGRFSIPSSRSHATSAATTTMPYSPSTQATSIRSRDSTDNTDKTTTTSYPPTGAPYQTTRSAHHRHNHSLDGTNTDSSFDRRQDSTSELRSGSTSVSASAQSDPYFGSGREGEEEKHGFRARVMNEAISNSSVGSNGVTLGVGPGAGGIRGGGLEGGEGGAQGLGQQQGQGEDGRGLKKRSSRFGLRFWRKRWRDVSS